MTMIESGWSVQSTLGVTIADTAYETFPDAARLPSGRIVVTWSATTDHYGPNSGRVAWSDDDGATWTAPAAHGSAAALATMGGRIAALQITSDPRTGWVQLSEDGGETWGTPRQITWGATTGWIFPAHLLWVDNGTTDGVMYATSYGPDGVLISTSTNAGLSWSAAPSPYQGSTWDVATEPTMLELSGGNFVMLIRNDTTGNIEMLRTEGGGWTTPTVVMEGMSGLPRMTRMPDGIILATLRDVTPGYEPDRGWAVGWSDDDGLTWASTRLVDDGLMMYGRFLPLGTENALLVGSSQSRAINTRARAWVRTVTKSDIANRMQVVQHTYGRNAISYSGSGSGIHTLTRTTTYSDGRIITEPVAGAVGVNGGQSDVWIDGDAPYGESVASVTYQFGASVEAVPVEFRRWPIVSDPSAGQSVITVGAEIGSQSWQSATTATWLDVRVMGAPAIHSRPEQSSVQSLTLITTSRTARDTLNVMAARRQPICFRTPELGLDDMWFVLVGERTEERILSQSVNQQWRQHTWDLHAVPRPVAARHTLHNLGEVAEQGETLGDLAALWATLGDIAIANLGPEVTEGLP